MDLLTTIEDPTDLKTGYAMNLGSIVSHRYDPGSHGLVVEVFTKNAVKVLWSKYSRKNVVFHKRHSEVLQAVVKSISVDLEV
jgi:hypothetical protein